MIEGNSARERADNLSVFISYARRDKAFARRLVIALDARGFATHIDERDMEKLVDWRSELIHSIRRADTVLFIISPSSIASKVCAWEVEQAVAFNKRLAPVVLDRGPDDLIPAAVARINYVYFDPPNDFDAQADELAKALLTHSEWLRENTRLTMLADRWNASGKPISQLLRVEEIDSAFRFLSERPANAPQVREVLLEFLNAGRAHETSERNRMRRGAAMAFHVPVRKSTSEHHFDHVLRLLAAAAIAAQDPRLDLAPELLWEDKNQLAFRSIVENRVLAVLHGHTDRVLCASFNHMATLIITGSSDRTARVWSTTSGRTIRQLVGHGSPIRTVRFSPSGGVVITASEDGEVRLWRLEDDSYKVLSRRATVSFGPEECTLTLSTRDERGAISSKCHCFETGDVVGAIPFVGGISEFPFSDRGRLLVGHDGVNSAVWETKTGNCIKQEYAIDAEAAIAYPGNTTIAVPQRDGPNIEIRDVRGWKYRGTLSGHAGSVRGVSFSSDGARIVSGAEDRTARIWDVGTGETIAILRGHAYGINSAEFDCTGRMVVTAADDGTARLWDAALDFYILCENEPRAEFFLARDQFDARAPFEAQQRVLDFTKDYGSSSNAGHSNSDGTRIIRVLDGLSGCVQGC